MKDLLKALVGIRCCGAEFSYEGQPVYQQAVTWYNQLDPKGSVGYALALSEAKEEFLRSLQGVLVIESKAEKLLSTIGILVGVVLTASRFAELPFLCFLPSISLLLWSIGPAMAARRTMNLPSPMEAPHLIDLEDRKQTSGRINCLLAGSYHCGLIALAEIREFKSRMYMRSANRFVMATWALLIPVVVLAF